MEKFTPKLHWLDFLFFFAMLLASLGIGVYHSLRNYLTKRRQADDTSSQKNSQRASTDEYLLGSRQMSVVPVSLSMIVSFVSSILILGYPAETYAYGGQYWLYAGGHALAAVLAAFVCVPVLYPLRLTSVNQYLMMRYNSRLVQLFGTVSSLLFQLLYTGAVFYTPSTAIEAASGGVIRANVCILVSCAVSVVYTTLGGIKAVIWTDVLQSVVMLLGLVAILVKGIILLGGLDVAWKIDHNWGRLHFFDFNPDPRERLSFWALIFGVGSSLLGAYGTSQMGVQRFSSLPTINKARLAVLLVIPGTVTLTSLACLSGLVIFAYYAHQGCDPLAGGVLSNPTQLVPYFVMQVLSYPGVPGLFLAAIVAGSLSSASSALNSASANILCDIVRPLKPNLAEHLAERLAKLIVMTCGIIALAIAFAAMAFKGTIIQIIYGLASATTGPITAVFLLGFFFPFINWKGALAGGLVGLVASLWLAIGSLTVDVHKTMLPSPTGNCSSTVNVTYMMTTKTPIQITTGLGDYDQNQRSSITSVYQISYLWFGLFSYLVTSLTAVVVSLCTGKESDVEDALLHPITRRIRKRRVRHDHTDPDDRTIGKVPRDHETRLVTASRKGTLKKTDSEDHNKPHPLLQVTDV